MADSFYTFDPVAGNNTSLDTIPYGPNQLYHNQIDNLFRAYGAKIAQLVDDLGAVNTVAGTDTITVALASAITAYATGQFFRFIAANTNTGAATMNVNSIGAKKIRKISGGTDVALAAGDLAAGVTYDVIYRATADAAAGAWIVLGSAAVSAATTSAAGIVELATQTEAATLTDTSRAITADGMFFLGGYTTTATAAGTTTLTVTSNYNQYFTGTTTQTLVLPVTSTLVLGRSWRVVNNSTGSVTVQSSGANNIVVVAAGTTAIFTCILTSGTTAASWDFKATITLVATQATTSGTSIDFTGIPAGVKKITMMFVGVSTNGTSIPLLQIGDAGGVETSGYLGSGTTTTASVASANYTAGVGIQGSAWQATNVLHGAIEFNLVDAATFTWVIGSKGLSISNTTGTSICASSKSLTATLDRVRLTTVNGTDAFDAGLATISYEF